MQDIEFTVQENRLWMLQCRTGKRTGKGAVKIAVDMVNEGLIDHRSALKMVEPRHLDQLLHPQVLFKWQVPQICCIIYYVNNCFLQRKIQPSAFPLHISITLKKLIGSKYLLRSSYLWILHLKLVKLQTDIWMCVQISQ